MNAPRAGLNVRGTDSFLINLNPGGRLGNHLFNFAWMIEISRRTGAIAINPTFAPYKQWFETPSRQVTAHWPTTAQITPSTRLLLALLNRHTLFLYHHIRITRQWRLDEAKPYLRWVPGLKSRFGYIAFDWLVGGRHAVKKLGPTFVYADGQPEFFSARAENYVRSKRTTFFDSAAIMPAMPSGSVEILREYFRPEASIAARAAEWLSHLRTKADVVVGVAVRQGDFRTWGNGADFVDPSLFQNILLSFTHQLQGRRCLFALCSDEPIVPEQYPGLQAVAVPPGPPNHFCTLAGCDFIIGTAASTFIQWASFMGNVPMRAVSPMNVADSFKVHELKPFGYS